MPTILVSRIDRIGDVVLTLPLCGLLKERLGARVVFLARRYTRDVVAASDAVPRHAAGCPIDCTGAACGTIAVGRCAYVEQPAQASSGSQRMWS